MVSRYNYYKLEINVSAKLGKFKYFHYYSLARTIALKEKSSVNKVMKKYGVNVKRKSGTGTRKIIGVSYKEKNDTKTLTYFNDSLKRVKTPSNNVIDQFTVPISRGCQLIYRLNANKCELCGCEKGSFEVHHIRKLKDIKKKYAKRGNNAPLWALQMCRMNRKTLVLCVACHDKLRAGKL